MLGLHPTVEPLGELVAAGPLSLSDHRNPPAL
ncbi:hypothetical protein [Phaeobacter marinintestinus]